MSAALPWPEAAAIAKACVESLLPVCERARVAGSVRRRKAEVGDIEIVAEPRIGQAGLFGEGAPDLAAVRYVASQWGEIAKDGDRYMRIDHDAGVSVDLFLVHPPAEWAVILAIRTGPADLARHAVTLMQERGIVCRDGRLVRHQTGDPVPTPDEDAFFAAAGLPLLPPARRGTPEAYRQIR